jgi:hypothetical protein
MLEPGPLRIEALHNGAFSLDECFVVEGKVTL